MFSGTSACAKRTGAAAGAHGAQATVTLALSTAVHAAECEAHELAPVTHAPHASPLSAYTAP
jgi:hypothetical protein